MSPPSMVAVNASSSSEGVAEDIPFDIFDTKRNLWQNIYWNAADTVSDVKDASVHQWKRFDPVPMFSRIFKGCYWGAKTAKSHPLGTVKGHAVTLGKNVLAGFTVALALLPASIAFAFVADVNVARTLYTTALLGLVTSLFGTSSLLISGASGALSVVQRDVTDQFGPDHLVAATILMGLVEVLVGLFSLGSLMKLVSKPVLLGFLNGLAIVIARSQVPNFTVGDGDGSYVEGLDLFFFLFLVLLTVAITLGLPYITRIIPSAFAGIVVATIIEHAFSLGTRSIGAVSAGFPTPKLPDVPPADLPSLIGPAVSYTAIGLLQTYLTARVLGTDGGKDREATAQGVGNIIAGVFGGIGGSGLIGHTIINVDAGATSRLSGVLAALTVFIAAVGAGPAFEIVPLASLTGVVFATCWSMFDFNIFKLILLRQIPLTDAATVIIVILITVLLDAGVAIGAGVLLSSVILAWKSGDRIQATTHTMEDCDGRQLKVYSLNGTLCFSSVDALSELITPQTDPLHVILDFKSVYIHDSTAMQLLANLASKYTSLDRKVYFANLMTATNKTISLRASSLLMENAPLIGNVAALRHNGSEDGDGEDDCFAVGVDTQRSGSRMRCFASGEPLDVPGKLRFWTERFHSRWGIVVRDYFHPKYFYARVRNVHSRHEVGDDGLHAISSMLHSTKGYEERPAATTCWLRVDGCLPGPLKYRTRDLVGFDALRWEDKDLVLAKMHSDGARRDGADSPMDVESTGYTCSTFTRPLATIRRFATLETDGDATMQQSIDLSDLATTVDDSSDGEPSSSTTWASE